MGDRAEYPWGSDFVGLALLRSTCQVLRASRRSINARTDWHQLDARIWRFDRRYTRIRVRLGSIAVSSPRGSRSRYRSASVITLL
jgi:hypothetical protein